mmetsp:Transcript_17516/g.42620  ORF Transcript_17516/g.42620 Transcript_17516/m.42620 type:complete len:597 (-) Transcript_17516:117-1907(-)
MSTSDDDQQRVLQRPLRWRRRRIGYHVPVLTVVCLYLLIQYTDIVHYKDEERNTSIITSTTKVRFKAGTPSSTSTDTTSILLFNNATVASTQIVEGNGDDDEYDDNGITRLERTHHRGRLYYCGWTSGMQARWMFPDYRYVGKWQPPVYTMPFHRPSQHHQPQPQSTTLDKKKNHHHQEQQMIERVIQSQPYTEQDLLVFGMHGPCAGESSYSVVKLMHYFPGKILFINGENFGTVQHQQPQPEVVIKQDDGGHEQPSDDDKNHTSKRSTSNGATTMMAVVKTTPRLGPGPAASGSASSISRSKDPYERVYQIGPYPPRLQLRNTLQVYTGIYWSTKFFLSWKKMHNEEQKLLQSEEKTTTMSNSSSSTSASSFPWLWLVDPTRRRKNTGRMGNAVVYLTTNCVPFRQYAAQRIYDKVGLSIHSGPKCQLNNNVSSVIPEELLSDRKSYHSNYQYLFHQYKYCLVMENDAIDGYITEKIIMGFLGGCLPIYYGTKEIFDIFNPGAFIFYNVSSFHHRQQKSQQQQQQQLDDSKERRSDEDALDLLQQIELNVTLYTEMLSAPVLKNGQETINNYFSILPDLGDGSLHAKIRSLMGD